MLLERGADPDARTAPGRTARLRAVQDAKSVALVRLLLKHGADPVAACVVDGVAVTPLQAAQSLPARVCQRGPILQALRAPPRAPSRAAPPPKKTSRGGQKEETIKFAGAGDAYYDKFYKLRAAAASAPPDADRAELLAAAAAEDHGFKSRADTM